MPKKPPEISSDPLTREERVGIARAWVKSRRSFYTPEQVLDRVDEMLANDGERKLTKSERQEVLNDG